MARSEYVARAKSILYGQGLGEKPPLRRVAATSNVSVSGSVVTFDLLANEGQYVKAGDILAHVSENDADEAYVFYVTGVSTDTVTAFNGYHGAPAIANSSTDMDAGFLEHNPLRTEFEIHKAVDIVFENWLYPEVFKFVTATATPDMQTGQVDLPSAVREIDTAWQTIGGEDFRIPASVKRNLHATMSANNVQGTFMNIDASTIYYTYHAKLAIGDEDTEDTGEALVNMVATGAASMALDMTAVDGTLSRARKDSQQRQMGEAASRLLRSFLTQKQNWQQEDAQDSTEVLVERYA